MLPPLAFSFKGLRGTHEGFPLAQDADGAMFDATVPGLDNSLEDILQHGETGESHAHQAAKNSGSFKLLVLICVVCTWVG